MTETEFRIHAAFAIQRRSYVIMSKYEEIVSVPFHLAGAKGCVQRWIFTLPRKGKNEGNL